MGPNDRRSERRRRSDDVARSIRRSLGALVIATAVLYLALFAMASWTLTSSRSNSDALCALRGDLESRVAASQEFLADHPDGIPGLPAKAISDGVVGQQRTIVALSGLSC